MAAEVRVLESELAAFDALDIPLEPQQPRFTRLWMALWPRALAVVLVLVAWQLVVLSGWRPDYVLPGPGPVFGRLFGDLHDPAFYQGVAVTLQRATIGYAVAVVIGGVVGALVARSRVLRAAVGSLITGLQSMPSIAWLPLAILLFRLSEGAILFVVVLGAAPAIANGLISGIDHIPPLLLRSGRMMGARGLSMFRHVVLPASLPSFVVGLKQGWAFAWRSLMAAELLVILSHQTSVGVRLSFARELLDAEELLATMLVILVIGMAVDSVFGVLDRGIRVRWGLAGR